MDARIFVRIRPGGVSAQHPEQRRRWVQTGKPQIDLGLTQRELAKALFGVLGAHPAGSNPYENPCVHTAEYGTRSSSVVFWGATERAYWYADGTPCDTKYRDFTALLGNLQPSGRCEGQER